MSADVLVVGAGLIGTSIAWRLSQAGFRVTLADTGKLGGEASSAGAGMLTLGGEFHEPSVWLDLGIEGLPLYPSFVEELQSETGLPIDFRICGSLQIGAREGLAEFHRAAGIKVEQTPEGLFYPQDGLVDPVDLLRALRCACERRRVQILEHHALDEIESSDYAAVVIAAGAWSG
jgi:glycine oxidase